MQLFTTRTRQRKALLLVGVLSLGAAACSAAGANTPPVQDVSCGKGIIAGQITDTNSQIASQQKVADGNTPDAAKAKYKVKKLKDELTGLQAKKSACDKAAAASTTSTTSKKSAKPKAPPVDWTDPAKWPTLSTAELGDPGPGRCFPRVLDKRREQVAAGEFKSYEKVNGAIDFAPPYSTYELSVLQSDIGQVIHDGKVESTRPHCLEDLAKWLVVHEDYTLASQVIGRKFDASKRQDLEDYFSKLKLVELTDEIVVQNHLFSADNGVLPFRIEKEPVKELVFFVPGYQPGNVAHNALRPLAKLACGNPLLPPPPPPPSTPTPTTRPPVNRPPGHPTPTTRPPQCQPPTVPYGNRCIKHASDDGHGGNQSRQSQPVAQHTQGTTPGASASNPPPPAIRPQGDANGGTGRAGTPTPTGPTDTTGGTTPPTTPVCVPFDTSSSC